MKAGQKIRAFAGLTAMLVFLSGIITVTHVLTSFIYQSTGITLPAALAQAIDSVLGLFLSFLIILGLTSLFARKRWARQRSLFEPIVEAMERISKGDFSVRLGNDLDKHENEIFGELVNSVNNMAQELSQMERMRQEFISNVSHEIQSPLTSIRGFAQALHDDHLSTEERGHYLSIIENESTRLSRITDNLLRLASLESDRVKFEPKPFRLDKQIRNLILTCEPQWAGKGIDMDVSLEEVTVTADEALLSQVWMNVVNNSIKFTPAGGSVYVVLHQQGGKIVFKITDTGCGISEQDQAHVFERFYKADKSRERSNEGSGLGLSIVKKIVEMHKGTVDLESKLGTGTAIIISLPTEVA